MDPFDLFVARMSASKRNNSLHHSQQQHLQSNWDRFSIDDFDAEDDMRPEFSCPYCYEDFDIATLCSHLEDEHLYECRGVVCPVCAAKVAKDLVGHIVLQHGHSFKIQRRRRFRRTSIPPGASLSFISKEFKEAQLQALLGGNRSSTASSSNNTDSFLSALMHTLPIGDVEDSAKSSASSGHGSRKIELPIQECKPSIDASLSAEEREQNLKQAMMRATFVQQLLISTIMDSS